MVGRSGRLTAALAALAWVASAATPDAASWSLTLEPATASPGSRILGKLKAVIEPGWHVYSLTTPKGGANPTRITLAPNPAVERVRVLQPKPRRRFDPNFNVETESFEGEPVFLLDLTLKPGAPSGKTDVTANLRYQVCNDRLCINAKPRAVTAALAVDASAPKFAGGNIPAGYMEFRPGSPAAASDRGLPLFLLTAFAFGLAAIFTPCVFPMIPITMSFFLNRETDARRGGIVQAGIFCLGIVVLFSAMGLIVTAIAGPAGVVQLGNSPWVNGFIALIFCVFGLSLLGAFEITIPSSVLTRLDRASQGGGTAGTLLMGLTFSLTSFACVGPFVGTLLAASVAGGAVRPVFGMLMFATGLALPFFVLALFPSWLKRLPRSGGWLARVKVVMGFLILAAMLKYLASVDQVLQWGFLTRERFLAAWIVLFAMAGLYLLGFLRLEGVSRDEPIGMGRLLAGIGLLIFAISLVPGMFGGRLGELDAYVPLSAGPAGFNGGGGAGEPLPWMKNQLQQALDRARREHKLVFVNFTGYACTNCHWMKANMFTRPEIGPIMRNFILVELYTDGSGDEARRNQQLEEATFSTIAIPYYAIYDADGKVLASFPGLTRSAAEFLAFLNSGSAAQPAAPASDPLELTSLDGGVFNRSALDGKVVVLNFWATWCVPCIREIPSFNRLNDQLASKGVAFVGISMDEEGAAAVTPFLKDHPIRYSVALGSTRLGEAYQVAQLPTTIVLDRVGKPLQRFEGFTRPEQIEAAIKTVL